MDKKKFITGTDVLRQLKADLIGKDSYRGVTLTYSWLANQFGHISLGFIPTLITYPILKKHPSIQNPAFCAALIISITWLAFEIYNFLGPLLSNRQSSSKLLFLPAKKYVFPPPWGNIAFDTITDLSFFWLGAFSVSLFLHFNATVLIIIAVLIAFLIYPCCYWFLTKMYSQYAGYPFQFRLAQWDVKINDQDKATVYRFLENKNQGKHLLVFGGRRSGKTSLSIALGTEASIKHKACLYTTGMKLYNMFFETEEVLLSDQQALWSWRTAPLMIIDDINPGKPVEQDLVKPQLFLNFLDTYLPVNKENRKIISEKNIVWVLGRMDEFEQGTMSWKEMLIKIGVNANSITSIGLQDSYLE